MRMRKMNKEHAGGRDSHNFKEAEHETRKAARPSVCSHEPDKKAEQGM